MDGKKYLIITISLMLFALPGSAQTENDSIANRVNLPVMDAPPGKSLSYSIITSINDTYGYDIFSGKKLLIHQTNKPGLPGNEGFKTMEDAQKVAELVIQKIQNGQMPPTVNISELKSLGVTE
jgi:hypothetical protein